MSISQPLSESLDNYNNVLTRNSTNSMPNGPQNGTHESSAANTKKSKMGSLKKWFSRLNTTPENEDMEKIAHKEIEKEIANQAKLNSFTMSMLLLGAGGSGKSTVLKQMDKIHNAAKYEANADTLAMTIHDVHKNITSDIYDLCQMYYTLKRSDADLSFDNEEIESKVLYFATNYDPIEDSSLTIDLASDIEAIWNTKTMRKVFDIRKKSHIMDNTPYFLDKVKQFADPNYTVTFDDFVRVRDQTTGIVNTEFTVQNGNREWLFKMIDVGGQRAERRKWLHVFAGIDVVIYVMSLSAYDQVLYEDHGTRCWDETLQLFEKTANNKLFRSTDFIVFLNKSDIFHAKIKSIPFTVYNADFDEKEASDGETVIDWVKGEFTERFKVDLFVKTQAAKNGNKRGLNFHVTCATDTDQIEHVVKYVQVELIRGLMSRAALL